MALAVLKYSSANAKARGLLGKLLSGDDYAELLNKKSVGEIAAYLKQNTVYKSLLADVNENLVHRGELEKLFSASLYGDFIKLSRFLGGNAKKFLDAAFLRYEVEDLKKLLRVVYTGRNSEVVRDSLVFLKNYSNLNYNKLTSSTDIPSLIGSLKKSEYYKVLSPFLNSAARQNYFDMEMSLDLHYFLRMLRLKDELLSGSDLKSVTHSLGLEIDILNILIIYRSKKLFNLPAETVIKYIIPHRYRLKKEELISLSESKDVHEFIYMVSKTRYAGIFKPEEEHLWDINSRNYMYRHNIIRLRSDYFNLGATMAYLHLKEVDIKNIITLIEGIRYKLPEQEIKSYLVGIK